MQRFLNTVNHFADELRMPAPVLLEQLRSAGIALTSVDDEVTDDHKARLLNFLRRAHGADNGKIVTLTRRQSAETQVGDDSVRMRTFQVAVRRARMFVKRDLTGFSGDNIQTRDRPVPSSELPQTLVCQETRMKSYESLFKEKGQSPANAFAHFFVKDGNYDKIYTDIANETSDGYDAWEFKQERFKSKNKQQGAVPKLKNYLKHTFLRLQELEKEEPQKFFFASRDGKFICFNTGLQNKLGNDIVMVFMNNEKNNGEYQDWVYNNFFTPTQEFYKETFGGSQVPDIAHYGNDSRDFVFNTRYGIDEKNISPHAFERAKERMGAAPNHEEFLKNDMLAALAGIVPKIKRNYRIAVPMYYFQEKRMSLLLPFDVRNNDGGKEKLCFVASRNDEKERYDIPTVLGLDQAYYAARLIVRPDDVWLNP